MEDITGKMADLAPEDRVYRTETGLTIKVKTLHDAKASFTGCEVLQLTGSVCDAAGKALRRIDGVLAIEAPTFVYAYAKGPSDIAAEVEAARQRCVETTARGHEVYELLTSYREGADLGLATVSDQSARKAAEAAASEV